MDAKQLIEEKRVLLDSVSIDFQPFMRSDEMAGYVRGHVADPKGDRQMTLIFDRDNLLRAECGVPGCGGRYDSSYYANSSKKICIHLLALMLLVDAYLKKYNPGDATNREGRMLLNQFRGQHAREVLGQQAGQLHDFSVEPVLEKTYNGLYLTLKAGVEKLYVVKDLTELFRLYDGRKIITFGTKTEVDLSRHRISQVSESLFEYVRQIVREEQSRVEHTREVRGYYYTEEEIKGRILLFGERIDRLYDLCEGKSVACNDKSNGRTEKGVLTFCAGKPKIQIQVEKDVDSEQVFHGVHVTGSVPDFVRGSKYRYYFTSDKFCRIGMETAQEIMPLLELGAHGDISFKVGRKYLAEFYHEILPVLRRSVEVEEPEYEHIQEYIPPEAAFVFYLDAENGNVSCRPQAHYGERKVSLLDNLREDHGYEWFRSDNREEEILYHVQQLFPVIDLEKDEMRCEDSEEAVLRLLDGGVDRLMALGEVHTTDRFRNISVRKKPKLKVGVSIESDIMNLSITSEDISQEELLQILQSYQRKKKYYRLKNGDLITVSQTDMEMLQQMMETMQISPKEFVKGNMQIPIYRALYLNKMLEQSENVYLNRDRCFKNLVKEFKTVEDSEFEVPSNLMPIMRGYQVHGFKWLKTLEQYGFGGILADDMGLGKTLQAISLLLDAKQKGGKGTALIVSPASLVYNWGEEFIKFAPDLKVTLVVGNQQERKELIKNYQDSDVLVTSYDLLKRDVVEYF